MLVRASAGCLIGVVECAWLSVLTAYVCMYALMLQITSSPCTRRCCRWKLRKQPTSPHAPLPQHKRPRRRCLRHHLRLTFGAHRPSGGRQCAGLAARNPATPSLTVIPVPGAMAATVRRVGVGSVPSR